MEKEEYDSKSELGNYLIRKVRKQKAQIDLVKTKIEKAEKSGFTNNSKEDILKQSKASLNG